jgi:hypothetical protein
MPRGLSSTITDELDKTAFAAPIWCVRITRQGGTLRWAETGNDPTGLIFNDGFGTQTYEVRIVSISGIGFDPNNASEVTIRLANTDGAITDLDREESFAGCRCEIIAYVPGPSAYHAPWFGWCDDIAELTAETATLKAYPTVSVPNVQVPQRTVGLSCTNEFANVANWTNYKDFEGSECPYGLFRSDLGITVGFRCTLSGGIDGVTDPVTLTANWGAATIAAGARFKAGDVLIIGTEKLLAISTVDPSGNTQSVTASRGYLDTDIAAHSDGDTISFGNCQYAVDSCKRRGTYGNNFNDTFSGGLYMRNYFGGFPFLVGYQYGRFRSKAGERTGPARRLTYSGNDSSYGRALALVYGRVRISDPVLLMMKPEGDFQTSTWVVCEGILATNATNDDQTTPSDAYVKVNGLEQIFVNGESRHDTRPGYGIEAQNGTQDVPQPSTAFFPAGRGQINDFIENHLGFWGTARVTMRINTKSAPSVDLNAGSVTGSMEVRYGRIVRVYSDTSTYVRKATTSPAWVMMDILTAKRAGIGLDYSRLNIQSFIDLANYCNEVITSTVDGSNVPRWSFNGVLDQRRSMNDWMQLIAIGCYSLPPYADKDGLLKVRPLQAETGVGAPLFSSTSTNPDVRNILWNGNSSSLVKSRRPIAEIPNEITVNFIEKSFDPGFAATLQNTLNATSNPVTATVSWDATALAAGTKFRQSDVVLIESEQLIVRNIPADPDGSGIQHLSLQRAYNGTTIASHTHPNTVQFQGQGYEKVSVVIADRDVQKSLGLKIGDGSRRVVSKSVDLPGTTTLDEAARLATLLLRAGEFGQGGLSNNLTVSFNAFHRDAEDLEVGDIIELQDDLLDTANGERFFRVTSISTQPISYPGGGFDFIRQIEAVLHPVVNGQDVLYDDTAITVSEFTRIDAATASDALPPAVTGFSVVESGYFDANGNPAANLEFLYTEPDPLLNFRSVAIHVTDDDSGQPNEAGWRYIGDVYGSGLTIGNFEVTGTLKWFCAVSRAIHGHVPDVSTLESDGATYVYPRYEVTINGVTDSGVPDAPVFGAIRSLAQAHTSRYDVTLGVDSPGSPANWNFIGATQIQAASDSGFTGLNGAAILNKTFNGQPPLQLEFSTNYPGTYYFRARVENEVGWSSWTTVTLTTEGLDLLTDDTDLMPGVTPDLTPPGAIGGNETMVSFDIPTTQAATCWGYSIIINDSNSLPSDTNFDSGTHGAITPGSSVMTDSTKSFTPGALVGKQLRIFSDKRGGSPTFDGEGAIVDAKITANSATTITFLTPSQQMTRNLSGLTYHVCNVGNSWTEKVKYCSPAIVDSALIAGNGNSGTRTRSVRVPVNIAPHYAWVVFYNAFGMGKVGSSATASISGITTLELKDSNVTTNKLGSASVTASKISVSTLDAITVNAGTITAGTFIGTTFKTGSSGSRIEIDSTNGLRSYDSGGALGTQIPVSNGFFYSNNIGPLGTGGSDRVNIRNGDGNAVMFLTGTALTVDLNGSGGVGIYAQIATTQQLFNVDTGGNYEWDINNVAQLLLDGNFKVRLGGSLRTIQTFNDGTHNVLYY